MATAAELKIDPIGSEADSLGCIRSGESPADIRVKREQKQSDSGMALPHYFVDH